MYRNDLSNYLIHFTKGKSEDEAFGNLCNIISTKKLLGSSTKIADNSNCVCFTETPFNVLRNSGFVNKSNYTKYYPLGIIIDKKWAFNLGARPVIYQKKEEINLLHKSIQWRHVTYNLNDEHEVDFTWEREWRISTNELNLTPLTSQIFVLNKINYEKLVYVYNEVQEIKTQHSIAVINNINSSINNELFNWSFYFLYQ